MMQTTDKPTLFFKTQSAWEKWLDENHDTSDGIWLQFYKKGSGVESLTYPLALDVALCYGWIDSQAKSVDDTKYIQKFTPRRSKSMWSQINRDHIVRLTKEGRMKPAGLRQVLEAKKDGRWEAAYSSPSTSTMPDDLGKALAKNEKAKQFFETLNKTNRYAIYWRLQTAKKHETRTKRLHEILSMLEHREKFH